jgi:hypothetical protein
MEVVEAETWRGGVIESAELRWLTSRRRIRTAIRKGEAVRVARGRYALPDADAARQAAARLVGIVSHLSAAQLHGWELKRRPELPTITVRRNRNGDAWRRRGVDLKWRDLDFDEFDDGRRRNVRRTA